MKLLQIYESRKFFRAERNKFSMEERTALCEQRKYDQIYLQNANTTKFNSEKRKHRLPSADWTSRAVREFFC